MRLEEKYLSQIRAFFEEKKKTIGNARLFLFGSRVDDSKKGGDIDLLLEVTPERLQALKSCKTDWLSQLETLVDEQRVDLVIATKKDMLNDAFLRSIPKKVEILDLSS